MDAWKQYIQTMLFEEHISTAFDMHIPLLEHNNLKSISWLLDYQPDKEERVVGIYDH